MTDIQNTAAALNALASAAAQLRELRLDLRTAQDVLADEDRYGWEMADTSTTLYRTSCALLTRVENLRRHLDASYEVSA
jgi:hypothetical protein